MNAFEQLQQLRADYSACVGVFNAAQAECEAIIDAVRNRLTAERERHSTRLAELESQAGDSSRGATVRRLAAEELEQLQGRTYSATEAEKAAFSEQMETAKQAILDARSINIATREAIDAVNAETKRIWAEILGDKVIDMRPLWLDGLRKKFAEAGEWKYMNFDASSVNDAARRLLAMRIPDTIRTAFAAEYGVDLRSDSTYEDLVIARLRQLARVDLEAAALLSRYNIGVLEEGPTERGDCGDCL